MYNLYGYPEDKAWKEENHKTVFVTQYIAIDESWNEAVHVMSNIIPGVIRSVFFYPCVLIFSFVENDTLVRIMKCLLLCHKTIYSRLNQRQKCTW